MMAELSEVGSDAELIAEAEIGEEARSFLEGQLGQTILGMADQEIKAAQEELETVTDQKRLQELQNQAWRARSFRGWLQELVQKGDDALTQIMQKREQENG